MAHGRWIERTDVETQLDMLVYFADLILQHIAMLLPGN